MYTKKELIQAFKDHIYGRNWDCYEVGLSGKDSDLTHGCMGVKELIINSDSVHVSYGIHATFSGPNDMMCWFQIPEKDFVLIFSDTPQN